MGAGCSNGQALAVQDSVTKKITLTQDGKDHLKNISKNQAMSIDDNQRKDRGELNSSKLSSNERKLPSPLHQQLWDAVETNDIKVVEELLEKISTEQNQLAEVDLFDSLGNSMAHKAASLGHAEVLMLLLERTGAKPDLANAQLATPLHLACKNNRESVAKFLIGCGVDVNCQDEQGQAPLLICCIHGNYDIASLIIESSSAGHTPEQIEIDIRDHRGLTPLNCAAIKGDLKFSKLLIEKGGASIEEASPKGCTPLIYAARGGYHELVEYFITQCKASPLRQDSSGATLFHHAIEKSNLEVLETLLKIGGEFVSAIEIADNAGRTPLFEAVDNTASVELVRLLLKKRQKKSTDGGFGMKVNVLNYNGQTPLFSAVREGNMELIQLLVTEGGAQVDMNGGEMIKDESEEGLGINEEEFESAEEKNFMEAYKNCMTPLQLACILGADEIAIYLIEQAQANPNLQTNIKGYSCLHLAVLANKPEMLIELLTRTNANPNLPDYSGRTFVEMVETHLPSYQDTFLSLLDNLQVERLKRADNDSTKQLLVATHYYNPDDEREIKGFKDPAKELERHIEELQMQEQQIIGTDNEENAHQEGESKPLNQKRFLEMDDSEIEVEEGKQYEREVEAVFGRKIALGLMALNFKFKEIAMKVILKHAEKLLSPNSTSDGNFNISEFVRACAVAVDLTCKEKVVKVFNLCLQLLTLLITSAKIENSDLAIDNFKRVFIERSITLKLLQRSEEGNTRITNKIHECLLDYSFHPRIGEAHVSSFILQRINLHNKQASVTATKPLGVQGESRNQIGEATLGSFKGLLAQLALLYKFVNSFGVSAKKRGPLNTSDIVNAIIPSLSHQSQDVRNASAKILLDVQKLSGAVKEEKLASVPENIRNALVEKLRAQVVEKDQNQAMKRDEYASQVEHSLDDVPNSARGIGESNGIEESQETSSVQNFTGSKDQSLRNVLEFLTDKNMKKSNQLTEDFLTNTSVLLKSCLEDNNFNLYIQAIEVASVFFQKALFTEVVLGSISSLIRPIILRTTDTNTRLRKKSVEIIYQVWSSQPPASLTTQKGQDSQVSVPQIIADVICDQQLQERAIIGRLGLFIKRTQMMDGGGDDELNKKPHQVILGRNYEQLAEFACSWCTHKNTKVRQNALKLVVEICRVNSIDPRGSPFKQRIVNLILHLRASLRDPLVQQINEVCSAHQSEQYIDVNELELNLATKSSNKRAVSMDVHKMKQQALPSSKAGSSSNLPEIGLRNLAKQTTQSGDGMLPSLGGNTISLSAVQPSLVLPHSEKMSDEVKMKAANLIELFGLGLIQCFYSQSWSNRQAAIEKVDEQLYNLDPNRRDAMSCEINRKNFPIEENFKTFLELIDEGTKDPVLKNFMACIELLKKALPTFFRYLQPALIRKELMPLVSNLIKKTTDLKVKVREVALDFCLYLSHQSPIGPEVMVNQVLQEFELILSISSNSQNSNVAVNMGNSHMIYSCLKLLSQFQKQTKILDKSLKSFVGQQLIFNRFISMINASLKHQNPQVRKEAECLFKILYSEFGEKLDQLLTGQKQQMVTKLLSEAKQESGMTNTAQQQEMNVQRAQTQIRTEMISQNALSQLLAGQEEHLQNLKLPNAKKRLTAVVEIKKTIQKELVQAQGNPKSAKALFEPLSMLIRQLLSDDEPDIYMETLGILRSVVGALVPHMSTLDVHLMLGSFIGVIVANTVSGNIRTQIASDKVIIFFAKHSNIGPFVVAKDILKNIEKCIKAIQVVPKREDQIAALQDKKPTVMRFISILQLLLQHFSIVLCYQVEFYDKCIEIVADSYIVLAQEDQAIKNLCTQLIISLQKIDQKLLDSAIGKLDFSRKTPLRKALIELEHQSRAGKSVITQDHHAFANNQSPQGENNSMVPESPLVNRDTRGSNMTASSRISLFSPGTTIRGASPAALGMTSSEWGLKLGGGGTPQNYGSGTAAAMLNSTIGNNAAGQQNPFKNAESRAMRRMISLENENPRGSQGAVGSNSIQARQSVKMESITPGSSAKKEFVLPDIIAPQTITPLQAASTSKFNMNQILNQTAAVTSKISINSTGGAGFNSSTTYTPTAVQKAQSTSDQFVQNIGGSTVTSGSIIRPPLYVPQKREMGRSGTGLLNGQGIQGFSQTTQQQPQSLLNRTGPLPSSYVPPTESNIGAQPSTSGPQFKTAFNSNLYSGLGGSETSTSGSSSIVGGARSSSLQKKPVMPLGNSTLFKPQIPQPIASFETNVAQYQDGSTKSKDSKKLGDFM